MPFPLRRAALPGLLALLLGCSALAAPTKTARKPRPGPVRSDHAPDAVTYGGRADVMAFADDTAATLGLDREGVRAALAEARFQPVVARLIMPPPAGTAKNWRAYRARFVEPERVRAGAAFWDAQRRWLDAAATRYGVPPEIVVGIVGVETYYGRLMGGFRVLDALATLSFDFPPGRKDRSAFFRGELQQLLLLAERDGVAPAAIKGSYAGAIGLGQFMPGSILRFAVDGDGDERIDMHDSPADVVASIAHFLSVHGWQPGMPTHFAVKPPVDTTDRAVLLAPDIVPSFSAAQFVERGAELDAAGRAHEGPLALVELQNGSAAPSHVAGTQNFYALTRYNWSSYYALAVIELGRSVRETREAREVKAPR
ncbi:lytic murein transglycosylase B [Aquincola sp. S2]|uniref:Lytic murein transglycosylase B n=1 Tax=Pseudaquabacterium terrae TaxID=2732868 RepID=A0ABX2EN98_9BURK|nr:lytic murein transglycosylase B [Aquabacterium terrae]NRF70016.1 lytic murein transglycosylase B [Aquabacterium terrae]